MKNHYSKGTTQKWLLITGLSLIIISNFGYQQKLSNASEENDATKIILKIDEYCDRNWIRKTLVEDNLYKWLSASTTESGFFKNSLNRNWEAEKNQKATLVSQSRLIYVMSTGFDLTKDKRFYEATQKGSDFLLEHFKSNHSGKWYWSVLPNGNVISNSYNQYGHAFVIFGLSHAFRITGDPRYKEAAKDTWRSLDIIKEIEQPPDSSKKNRISQNPIMHTLEAILTLHDVTNDKYVLDDAFFIVEFTFDKLYKAKKKCLSELYDEKYVPLSEKDGGHIDIGHQFEWAYLLSWSVSKGLSDKYLEIGNKLIDFGIKHGLDRKYGGIWAKSTYSGKAYGGKYWWQQCEFLRAAYHYATAHNRDDLIPLFQKNLRYTKSHFIDDEFGGWFAQGIDKNQSQNDKSLFKGNPWKVGYHVTGMFLELLK